MRQSRTMLCAVSMTVGLVAAALADDPLPAPTTATAVTTATATAAAVATPSAATPGPKPSASLLKRAIAAGMRPALKDGVTVFCWDDATLGTRFKTKKCIQQDQFEVVMNGRAYQQDEMLRATAICNGVQLCGGAK